MIEDDAGAERLARAILDDITLSNEERVRASTDLIHDFSTEIEEGRALFRQRVASPLHHHFDDELLVWRGSAKDHAAKLGAPVDRTRLLMIVAAVVVFAGIVIWLVLR